MARTNVEISSVNITVPTEMVSYVTMEDKDMVLQRNALLLYPYIKNLTISHGKAAEMLGISKWELIELYDSLGLAYLNMDICEVEEEIQCYRKLKGEIV
ncbi:MAG: UPF0175 family protein [Clostridium sp.]|nr:UPF0175 family protein [Acetatifactor muris]MCM1527624.1 UPF0175 family protein [Bacteroides sp.]MCM1563640.1 UPF0175 family protein [Clostridium sp.]